MFGNTQPLHGGAGDLARGLLDSRAHLLAIPLYHQPGKPSAWGSLCSGGLEGHIWAQVVEDGFRQEGLLEADPEGAGK